MTACDPCPNVPRCPHPGTLHDIEDYDDLRPMCCAEDCTCGKPGDACAEEIYRSAASRSFAEWDNPDDAVYDQQQDPACPSMDDPKSSQVNGT